jgi:predicted acetyltransferase
LETDLHRRRLVLDRTITRFAGMVDSMTDQAELTRPGIGLAKAYVKMVERSREVDADTGYTLPDPRPIRRNPAACVERLAAIERGENLPADFVPQSTRWLVHAGTLVGETRIRHGLTPKLELEGGHVGYFIHPDHRSRGYGHLILARALDHLAGRGIDRALLTCNADNVASRRIILTAGGVFRRQTISPRTGKAVDTFWIARKTPAS